MSCMDLRITSACNQSHRYMSSLINMKEVWQVVSFHVDGNHHQQAINQIQYADQPLSSLDAIREIIGLDGSLKYLSWNSYSELPPEKIYLASKIIAQDYLFLHF